MNEPNTSPYLPVPESEKTSPLSKYLFLSVFLAGFISELGVPGANFGVLLLELGFILGYHLSGHTSPLSKNIYEENQKIFLLVSLWLTWGVISFLRASFNYELNFIAASGIKQIEYFCHILFAYYLYHYIKFLKISTLLFIIPFTVVLTGSNLFFAWFLNPEIHRPDLWLDSPVFYSNIRQAGFHCSVSILILLAFLYKPGKLSVSTQFLLVTMLAFAMTFLFWTGGRGTVIATYASILLWFGVLIFLKAPVKKIIITTIAATVLALFLSEVFAVMPWNGLFSAIERTENAESLSRLSSGRLTLWSFSLEQVKPHLILGLGANSYFLAHTTPSHFHPHNSLLQFLMDWGIIGLALTVIILSYFFAKGAVRYRKNLSSELAALTNAGGLVIFALCANSLIEGTLYHGQTSFYLAIAYACWLQQTNNTSSE